MNMNELAEAGETSISCYLNEIPSFIEAELVKSYETLHSSLPFFKTYRSIDGVNCYVRERKGHPKTVLLFTFRNKRIDVLNEMIEIEQSEVDCFARYVFTRFEQVDIISFKALKTTVHESDFPVQRHSSKDTYVIALPGTAEEYTESIAKSTRADIRRQTRNVLRDFPSFTSQFFVNEEVREEHVREIIAFSERKINSKGVKLSHDVDRIIALARMCGFIHVLLIDGRVCAGSVNYRIGSSYFGDVTGYDPEYEKYALGKLGAYHTICESIARGGTRFYLGGGVFEFKSKMSGVILSMDELQIYRSYFKMLVNLDRVARTFAARYVGRLKKHLHQHKQEMWARAIFKSFYFLSNKLAK
ncbi:GNAT family N-acetyltransferase [Massilia niabensis]|uniref:GNAT family N-acetyltransferase n=1 Tax=Massilia niabensis TaxID=544910 RepID=A0ABW0KXS5_9BURK